MPRLKVRYNEEIRVQLEEGTRTRQHHASAASRRDRAGTPVSAGPPSRPACFEGARRDLELITGQKPIVTRGREVDRQLQAARGKCPIGVKVTLRGDRACEFFFDRLISLASSPSS
jgi:large subunit ribosomal protein L5